MIAAVFVLVLALVIGVSSLMGGGAAVQVSQSVPWWALVCVVLWLPRCPKVEAQNL
jgi:hypothetical protein